MVVVVSERERENRRLDFCEEMWQGNALRTPLSKKNISALSYLQQTSKTKVKEFKKTNSV